MKHTDTELEEILNQLIASTRSPRGRFFSSSQLPGTRKKTEVAYPASDFDTHLLGSSGSSSTLPIGMDSLFIYATAAIQTISTLAETRTVRLPDGSSVMLNHYSSLSYPEKFQSDKREVELNGEAYFEVSKDPKHPFIVQTETIDRSGAGNPFQCRCIS